MSGSWKRRWAWGLAGGAGILIGVPAIIVAALQLTAPSAEGMLRARGLPVTLEGWAAWHDDDPGAPNAAGLYLEAAELRESDPDAAYALLVEASGYDYCRLPLQATTVPVPAFSFRGEARELWRLLSARAEAALANGDRAALMETTEALLALSHALKQQPAFLDYLSASNIVFHAAYELVPQALEADLLTADDVERIDARLERLERTEYAHRAVLGTMARWMRDSEPAADLHDASAPVAWLWGLSSIPARTQAVYARDFLRAHDILDLPYPAQREAVVAWEFTVDPVIELFERMSRYPYHIAVISTPDHFVDGLAISRGRLAAARAGLMAERFRFAHGRLPETAAEMEQAGLPLPADPLGDGPIRYALDKGGYRTWSVGLNMLDDGGIEERGSRPDLVFAVSSGTQYER